MTESEGRLVLNHSTHIEGLIPLLKKLISYTGIKTVTPGVIARTKSKTPHLLFRVSVATRGGFKVVARRGSSVQEVFIITTLSQEQLEQTLQTLLEQ
jgi:hypothetical protein